MKLPNISRQAIITVLDIVKALMTGAIMVLALLALNHIATVEKQNASLEKEVKGVSSQNTQLSLQNEHLARQNLDYQRCNANIFAAYTQTKAPIKQIDLDKCNAIFEATQRAPLLPAVAPVQLKPSAAPRTSSNGQQSSTPSNQPPRSPGTAPAPSQPSLLQRAITDVKSLL